MINNREWILQRRPEGKLQKSDFELREVRPDLSPLREGEVKVRTMLFLCAPSQRNWMNQTSHALTPSIEPGGVVQGIVGGQITQSAVPSLPVGTLVTALGQWQEEMRIDTARQPLEPIAPGLALIEALGGCGPNPRTAYFGLLRIGEPKAGDTLLVSGAAGSVGSAAVQIGKIAGCQVIGIAGGEEKCQWVREVCGADACINYRTENLEERLDELCPDGIDVFFDNVGGPVLQASIARMVPKGRIVLCGQIGSYDGGADTPLDMMRIVYGSIRLEGFLRRDFADEQQLAINQLREWMRSGEMVYRDDVTYGFEALPHAFLKLFSGANQGTNLVMTADEAKSLIQPSMNNDTSIG